MTPYFQPSLFEEPAAGTVVRDGAGTVIKPDGTVSHRRGRSYTWLCCDVCMQGTWVRGLAPDQDRLGDEEYRKNHGRACRGTPKCAGRHVCSREPS